MRWLTFKVRDEIRDLSALLRLVGDRATGSTWRLFWIEAAGYPEPAAELQRISDASEEINGRELLKLASQGPQIIEGELHAFDAGSSSAWLVIKAIDRSLWDVGTDDKTVEAAVRAEFPEAEDTTAHH